MIKLAGFLFGKGTNIQKRAYVTNLCSSMIYSIQSMFLLLIVTRIGGLYQAGVFSIIYTFTQMFASLGSYSMRNFQVSDTKNEYSFASYYSSRLVTCILMNIACIGYALFNGFTLQQVITVLMFSIYRTVDGVEDVFHGEVQKRGRLDVVSVAMFMRILISVVAFTVVYVITKELLLSSIVMALCSILAFGVINKALLSQYMDIKRRITKNQIVKLLWTCFPIFLGSILYNYLVNAPKYAINRNLTEEIQTIFNILFIPIFVINILSTFIFKPMIVKMSIWWNEKNYKKVVLSILRQSGMVMGLTILVAVCGYFLGCPVLSFIYGVDLSSYQWLFTILLLFGGISALSTFFSVVLTIIRKQRYIIIGYLTAFIVNYLFVDKIVVSKGIYGAGYIYGIIMSVVLAIFVLAIFQGIAVEYKRSK